MEIYLDCLPCFLRQVLEASRFVTDNPDLQRRIIEDGIEVISRFKEYRHSPEIGRTMHDIVKKRTGVSDPYKDVKLKDIKSAQQVYPLLKHFLYKKNDELYWALKVAVVGNTLDSAILNNIDLEKCLKEELEKKFSLCDIDKLEAKLKRGKSLLIIGDNAGETIFDRVLIEKLLCFDIVYGVRSEPIINDATVEDAHRSGLDNCAMVISTGCNAPGLILDECSDEFLRIFNTADIIISKGQGNYETLSDVKKGMFFLLKAKCPVISNKLGVGVNDYVFKWNGVD